MMKKYCAFSFVILLILMTAACGSSSESNNESSNEEVTQLPAYRDTALYQDTLTSSAQDSLSLLETATVYDADIEIESSYQTISGDLRAYYINNENTSLSEVYFRLFPNYNGGEYQIQDVQLGGETAAWEFESEKTALRVDLPEPLAIGDEIEILISFSLSVPEEMGGNYAIFGYQNNILAADNLFPIIPVYDDLGWHTDYPAKTGDLPFVDASFYHVKITAPEELIIAASGTETVVGEDQETGTQTIEVFAGPVRDFYLSASPLYTVETIKFGETEINSYALPGAESRQNWSLEVGKNSLSVFGDRLGEYPYTEFDIAASPVSTAMEYPGVIAVGLDKYGEDDGSSGVPIEALFVSAIVHETGHQWFYNMVGNDQVNRPWLDESFVMYLTHLYYVDIEGGAYGYDSAIGRSWNRVDRAEIPIGMPVTEYLKTEYSPIVYARGLYFMMELEYKLGADVLAAALKEYFQANLWAVVGPDDFKNVAESKCECDLTEIWEDWVLP
jgi:hypothetical protein